LAGYVVVTFLSFPHPLAGSVVDLGQVLAWGSPVLFILGLHGLSPRRALWLGFVASLVAHSAILHWIYVVTVTYGHAPVIVGLLAPVLLAIYIAGFGAVFAWGFARFGRTGLASPLAAALLWTALDHLRAVLFTGFPWATLGYAQHESLALMALAPYTGVYGLSFVTVLAGAAIARVLRDRSERRPIAVAAWASLGGAAALYALGFALQSGDVDESPSRVRIAAIQGNIDQGEKWSAARKQAIFAVYADLTRQAAADGAEWIVWPETAVPGALEGDPELRGRLSALASETGAELVVGGVGLTLSASLRPSAYFDSAFVFDPAGEIRDRYDKSHLVPFGEYVPFQDLIGVVVKAVARGIAPVGVNAGPGPRPIQLSAGGTRVPVGVPICYELLFPDLVRRFVERGGQVLLAITNDAWYGRTGAPYQFLAITAMRSAETRVWTVRAANTGVSAIIDSRGRVTRQTPIFESAWVAADVPLRPASLGGSFYTRHGDVFAMACWAGVAILGILSARRTRRANATGVAERRAEDAADVDRVADSKRRGEGDR
jgi:apolipoprotein N-acyltransferase